LTFALAIGLGLWFVRYFVVPRINRGDDRTGSVTLRIGSVYASAAMIMSFVAAYAVHVFLVPGFMGDPRSVIISALYTLLFVALFTGISFAQLFYRQAVDRARAVETMRAELVHAELRALRAQINPHFLFNTLNSIAALIRIDPAAAE